MHRWDAGLTKHAQEVANHLHVDASDCREKGPPALILHLHPSFQKKTNNTKVPMSGCHEQGLFSADVDIRPAREQSAHNFRAAKQGRAAERPQPLEIL